MDGACGGYKEPTGCPKDDGCELPLPDTVPGFSGILFIPGINGVFQLLMGPMDFGESRPLDGLWGKTVLVLVPRPVAWKDFRPGSRVLPPEAGALDTLEGNEFCPERGLSMLKLAGIDP